MATAAGAGTTKVLDRKPTTRQVQRIYAALEPTVTALMRSHLLAGMADAQLPAGEDHAHLLTDQPPRHRIGVAVDLDRTVGLDPAHQLAARRKGRSAGDQRQGARLGPLKALDRDLAGRAMHPAVGDLARPLRRLAASRCDRICLWQPSATRDVCLSAPFGTSGKRLGLTAWRARSSTLAGCRKRCCSTMPGRWWTTMTRSAARFGSMIACTRLPATGGFSRGLARPIGPAPKARACPGAGRGRARRRLCQAQCHCRS